MLYLEFSSPRAKKIINKFKSNIALALHYFILGPTNCEKIVVYVTQTSPVDNILINSH